MKLSSRQLSPLRLIKWCTQWQDKKNWEKVPIGLRGIYVLDRSSSKNVHDVVYVGMATSGTGIKRRLRNHYRSDSKGDKWTHFSFYVVWENIREDEIRELEGLFREIYRKDVRANSLNTQKKCKDIQRVRKKVKDWKSAAKPWGS